MRNFLLLMGVLVLLPVLTGCLNQRELVEQRELIAVQTRGIDSLRTVERELWRQLGMLQDSLQFYDDIDSGRIYREFGKLNDRIERLEYELAVSYDGGLTLETLFVDDLFKPASAELTETGAARLDETAEKLASSFADRTFRIEAHSDNVPVGPSLQEKYPSNWELSAARAAAVVRYLSERDDFRVEQFAIMSYGDAKPVASNSSAEGRRRNRRIRIAVLPEAEAMAGIEQ